jgi:hypothetical protein
MPKNPQFPENQSQTKIEVDKLELAITRLRVIIDGLETNQAWKFVLEDLEEQAVQLDNMWAYVDTRQKWQEFRITKMAILQIRNMLDNYKTSLKVAIESRDRLVNDRMSIMKDVDNE